MSQYKNMPCNPSHSLTYAFLGHFSLKIIAQKYVEALQALATADNQKVLMLPVDATGVLGALEGVRELLKSGKGG